MPKMTTRHSDYQQDVLPNLGPETVGIVPANACNLNCLTCWSYSPLASSPPLMSWKRQQLPETLLLRTLEELAQISTKRIILTGGGDPLVYPHFDTIVKAAKSLGLKVTLISNLTLIRDFETFLQLKIDTILANFSCADAKSYVAFHPNRKEEEFFQLKERLKMIVQLGSSVKLVCVVCQTNAHLLPELFAIAAEIQAGIQLKLMSVTPDTLSIAITQQDKYKLLQQLPSLQTFAIQYQIVQNIAVFEKELQGKKLHEFPIDEVGCFAGYWYSRIKADGSVYYCCNAIPELKVGNIYEQSFTAIWQSEKYQQLRIQLKNNEWVKGCEKCGKFDLNMKIKHEFSE